MKMVSRRIGIIPLLAILAVMLLVSSAGRVCAQDDPSLRGPNGILIAAGDNGGGDPDNPVPLDGGGRGAYTEGRMFATEAPSEDLESNRWSGLSRAIRAAAAFLDALLLL